MIKRKKIQEIKSAPELLRVNSLYKKPVTVRSNFMLAIILILFALYSIIIMFILNNKSIGERLAYIFIIATLLGIALLVFYTPIIRSCFIITEKGVFAEPHIAEFWGDIESYAWEYYLEFLNRASQTIKREGTCLLIYTRDYANIVYPTMCADLDGHSKLAKYDIFFSPEQVEETDKIFQRCGIKKRKN